MQLVDSLGIPVYIGDTVEFITPKGTRRGKLAQVRIDEGNVYTYEYDTNGRYLNRTLTERKNLFVYKVRVTHRNDEKISYSSCRLFRVSPFILVERENA